MGEDVRAPDALPFVRLLPQCDRRAQSLFAQTLAPAADFALAGAACPERMAQEHAYAARERARRRRNSADRIRERPREAACRSGAILCRARFGARPPPGARKPHARTMDDLGLSARGSSFAAFRPLPQPYPSRRPLPTHCP